MLSSSNWEQLEPELELHATTDDDELPATLKTTAQISSNLQTPKENSVREKERDIKAIYISL